MYRNTQSTRKRYGHSEALCLEMMCRDVDISGSVGQRVSRAGASILNRAGVNLNPNLTITEQAVAAAQRGETWGQALCQVLDYIDPGHCERAPQWQPPSAAEVSGMYQGLKPDFLWQFQQLRAQSLQAGLPDPQARITSAYRSPALQATLLSRWELGDREGIWVKPASPDTSRHCKGEAVDLWGSNDEYRGWGAIWRDLGNRWGGMFFPVPDPGHFDLG